MKNKSLILSSILCLVPIFIVLIFYRQIPDIVATHLDMHGNPNGYSSKNFVTFVLPVVMLLINFVVHYKFNVDPRIKNASKAIRILSLWLVPVLSIIMQIMIISYNLGQKFNNIGILYVFMGILFLVIGNYLPKCKQNETVGIRTPWTLKDEEVWNKTHKIGGYLWVVGGFIMVILSLIDKIILVTLILIICTLIPIGYSFILYKKKNQ